MDTIITISRQFGSGGRLIGQLVAQKLGIPFYDKEIILKAAQNSGLSQAFIEENEQKRNGFLSYCTTSPSRWGAVSSAYDNLEVKVYAAEADAIEKCAKQGACVIVGRCADYVLKDKAKCLNVFVYADEDERVKRVRDVYGDAKDDKTARKLIRDMDKRRSRHYNFYTDTKWGDTQNYDICINSAVFGVEKCAEMLAAAYKAADGQNE